MENEKLVRMRAVQDAIDNLDWVDGGGGKIYVRQTELVDAIDSIPAVDAVEVRHARWERDKNGNAVFYCSECHEGVTLYPPTQLFCYHCGARMDGEDGDGDG